MAILRFNIDLRMNKSYNTFWRCRKSTGKWYQFTHREWRWGWKYRVRKRARLWIENQYFLLGTTRKGKKDESDVNESRADRGQKHWKNGPANRGLGVLGMKPGNEFSNSENPEQKRGDMIIQVITDEHDDESGGGGDGIDRQHRQSHQNHRNQGHNSRNAQKPFFIADESLGLWPYFHFHPSLASFYS